MPLFTPKFYLKKPTETEQVEPRDYNDNLDAIDNALTEHFADRMAHFECLSLYKLDKDAFGVFVELQWKRENGKLAKRSVFSRGTPPYYSLRTDTYYHEDGVTAKVIKTYLLTYDQDNALISEVLQ